MPKGIFTETGCLADAHGLATEFQALAFLACV